jgi:hypothetical protein
MTIHTPEFLLFVYIWGSDEQFKKYIQETNLSDEGIKQLFTNEWKKVFTDSIVNDYANIYAKLTIKQACESGLTTDRNSIIRIISNSLLLTVTAGTDNTMNIIMGYLTAIIHSLSPYIKINASGLDQSSALGTSVLSQALATNPPVAYPIEAFTDTTINNRFTSFTVSSKKVLNKIEKMTDTTLSDIVNKHTKQDVLSKVKLFMSNIMTSITTAPPTLRENMTDPDGAIIIDNTTTYVNEFIPESTRVVIVNLINNITITDRLKNIIREFHIDYNVLSVKIKSLFETPITTEQANLIMIEIQQIFVNSFNIIFNRSYAREQFFTNDVNFDNEYKSRFETHGTNLTKNLLNIEDLIFTKLKQCYSISSIERDFPSTFNCSNHNIKFPLLANCITNSYYTYLFDTLYLNLTTYSSIKFPEITPTPTTITPTTITPTTKAPTTKVPTTKVQIPIKAPTTQVKIEDFIIKYKIYIIGGAVLLLFLVGVITYVMMKPNF